MNRQLYGIIILLLPILFLLVSSTMTAGHLLRRGVSWRRIGVLALYVALLTLLVYIVWWAVGSLNGWFRVYCASWGWVSCPSQFEWFLSEELLPTLPYVLLLVLQSVLGIAAIRARKQPTAS